MSVADKETNEPVFYEIDELCILKGVYFAVVTLQKNILFDYWLNAYKVNTTKRKRVMLFSSLENKFPLPSTVVTGSVYIGIRHGPWEGFYNDPRLYSN